MSGVQQQGAHCNPLVITEVSKASDVLRLHSMGAHERVLPATHARRGGALKEVAEGKRKGERSPPIACQLVSRKHCDTARGGAAARDARAMGASTRRGMLQRGGVPAAPQKATHMCTSTAIAGRGHSPAVACGAACVFAPRRRSEGLGCGTLGAGRAAAPAAGANGKRP